MNNTPDRLNPPLTSPPSPSPQNPPQIHLPQTPIERLDGEIKAGLEGIERLKRLALASTATAKP